LAAVPGRELAFVSAHRPAVVDLSAQHLAQRSEAVYGTADRPVVVEGLEVEGLHLWAVAGSKADELSEWHSQVASKAVAAVVVVEAAVLAVSAVAVVRARYALAARYFAAAAAGESERQAQGCMIGAVARH
jgi:hypothetical protein